MNKRLISSLSIFAIAFALVLGFGAINYTNANANDLIAESFPGQVNLVGDDQAHNAVGAVSADRDMAPRPVLDSYGLQGAWLSTF